MDIHKSCGLARSYYNIRYRDHKQTRWLCRTCFHNFMLSISGQTFVKTTHTGLTETDASQKQMNWNIPLPEGAQHMKDIHILMLVKTLKSYTKTQVNPLF